MNRYLCAGLPLASLLLAAVAATAGANAAAADVQATASPVTVTPAQPTAGWESTQLFPGQFTGEFTGGCPDAATDPANVLCDHRTAIVDVPAGFWATHAGGVRITLDTLNTENEFHGLEVYQDGVLVASASFEEPTVFLAAAEGTYDVRVSGTINIPTFNDAYAGTVALEAAQVVAP